MEIEEFFSLLESDQPLDDAEVDRRLSLIKDGDDREIAAAYAEEFILSLRPVTMVVV